MKPLFVLFLAILSFQAKSQFNDLMIKSGAIDPVIQSIDSLTAPRLFNKINAWISRTFKNANAVKQGEVENEFIRFTGISANVGKSMGTWFDLEYTIAIDIKGGKYRFTVEQLRSGVGGTFGLLNLKDYYTSNGDPRKAYKDFVVGIENTLKATNQSLYKFITADEKKANDW
jgi:hypothetical protein